MDSNILEKGIDFSIFDNLGDDSRVWLYHADKVFTDEQVQEVNSYINQFCIQWTSHNQQLKAAGQVLLNRIVVLMVDESLAGASGCSIDKSVAFVKNLELKFGIALFDRMLITYLMKDSKSVKTTSLQKLKEEIGAEGEHILIADNLVKTKKELTSEWLKPIVGSWVERFI